MILPKLSEQEIEKLDILFNTLKKGALEDNRHGFFPISKPILLLITILSILLNFYQFYIDNKNERLIQQKQQTIDSLELVANDLNAKYKAPTHTDTKAMQDSSTIGQ
jgi:hypothetical protein